MRRFCLTAAVLLATLASDRAESQIQPGFAGTIITAATTYYVCAKANGGTCVYNGDAGTVAPVISDNNSCLVKSQPCATINGVATKLLGKVIGAVVTVQLANTAGTGTDCYRPNNTVFQVTNIGYEIDSSLDVAENVAAATGTYPTAYLYLLGNTTTPSNVIITGATTCAGTTANDPVGIRFSNTMLRVRGIQAQYFHNASAGGGGPDVGPFMMYRSVANMEDLYCVGDTTTTGTLIVAYDHSVVRLGSSLQWTITACNVLDVVNQSHGSFNSPLGRSNINITVSSGWTPQNALFSSNEGSHIGVDGLSLTVSGSGTATVWNAFAHSAVTWNDEATFVSPAITVSYNGAGLTIVYATQGSYFRDGCRTVGQLTCNIGNTTTILQYAKADSYSYVSYQATPTAVTNADSASVSSYVDGPTTSISDVVNSNFLVATSTLTKTSDAALATVVGLSQSLLAGKTYNCFGHLNGVSGATGGVKVALVASGGLTATSARFTGFTWNGITAVAQTTVTALGSNIVNNAAIYSDIYINGAIVVNVAGTINVQAAQSVSNGTSTTVLLGSTFACVRTN